MRAPIPRLVAIVLISAGALSCATGVMFTGKQLRKATIELWRDADDKCHTNTTPNFKIKKGAEKAKWTIVDDSRCLEAADAYVEILFDKGDPDPLVASCVKKSKTKIECDVKADATVPKTYKYSVTIPGSKEDPELQIEM